MDSRRGFSFDNCLRSVRGIGNKELEAGVKNAPKPFTTGTTLVGLVFRDGVMLGADSRMIDDNTTVVKRDVNKLFLINNRMCIAGSGFSADVHCISELVRSQLMLNSLNGRHQPRCISACRYIQQLLFRRSGQLIASFILVGIDITGFHLWTIAAHGSTDQLPYASVGSGSPHAMSYLESAYRPDMTENESAVVMYEALAAGVLGDMGSGNGFQLAIISRDRDEPKIGYNLDVGAVPGQRRLGDYRQPPGVVEVCSEKVVHIDAEAEERDRRRRRR